MSKRLVGLFLAGFSIRLLWIAALPWSEPSLYPYFDADGYLNAVEAFHTGRFLDHPDQIVRMPLYPGLMAFGIRSFTSAPISPQNFWSLFPIRLWHCLLDLCTLACIYLFIRRWISESCAFMAGCLYAVYPLTLYHLPILNTETIQGTAIGFWLLGAAQTLGTRKIANAILLSLLSAILVFISPALQFLPFCFTVALFFFFPWKEAVRLGMAMLIPFMLLSVAWGIRNEAVTGQFFLFDTRGGKEFWLGNNQEVDGRWEHPQQEIWLNQWRQYTREAKEKGGSDRDVNQYLYQKGIEEIRNQPWGALLLMGKKFLRFWFVPASERMILLMAFMQSFYLLLAIYGGYTAGLRNRGTVLPLFIIAYYCGIYTVSYACIRFCLPVMPWVCALGGIGLNRLWQGAKESTP